MVSGAVPDADGIWSFLQEPAGFFGVPMPDRDVLHAALNAIRRRGCPRDARVDRRRRDTAGDRGLPDFVVTGRVVPRCARPGCGCWARCRSALPARQRSGLAADGGPHDQPRRRRPDPAVVERRRVRRRRPGGNPRGGSTPRRTGFETAATLVGIDNPEPTSILDQLEGVRRDDRDPPGRRTPGSRRPRVVDLAGIRDTPGGQHRRRVLRCRRRCPSRLPWGRDERAVRPEGVPGAVIDGYDVIDGVFTAHYTLRGFTPPTTCPSRRSSTSGRRSRERPTTGCCDCSR